jgi:hypothetical protein
VILLFPSSLHSSHDRVAPPGPGIGWDGASLINFLCKLDLNRDPPDLSLPSRYRYESLVPGFYFVFNWQIYGTVWYSNTCVHFAMIKSV